MIQTHYVALRPMRFGNTHLNPGDAVPYEPERNYAMMVRTGLIREALPPSPSSADRAAPEPFPTGVRIVFVSEDGAHELGVYHGTETPDQETADELELSPGAQVALVVLDGDPDDPVYVPLSALLPEQPTLRLIEDLKGQEAGSPPDNSQVQALTARLELLETLLRAVRAEGEPLPEGFPGLKELQGNGIRTRAGLNLLTEGEQARANLVALDGIGDKTADKILAALAPARPESSDDGQQQ